MSRYILVREHGQNIPINAKAILRIVGDGEYVTVILKNGKKFTGQVGSIGDWKKKFKKLKCFVKISRSDIVNYHRIAAFSMAGGVVLSLCSVREYEQMLALPAGEEKLQLLKKNAIRLPLNPDGFVELMFLYDRKDAHDAVQE